MSLESIYETAFHQYRIWTPKANFTSTEEANKHQMERLDGFRISLEPYIYNYLIEKYGKQLSDFWNTYTPPKKATRAFVIVERRPHPNFWFILRNIAWANPEMAVYIFCSNENMGFVKSLLGNKLPYFNLVEAFQGDVSRKKGKEDYSNLMTNYRFYDFIEAEYIMTVQMDTFFRRKIPADIFQGTYWGNPWGWAPHLPGGGGITIRNVKNLARHCRKYRPDTSVDLSGAEDAWLAEKLHADNGDFPDINFRANYIIENIPTLNPVAVHQFWTFLDSYQITDKMVFITILDSVLKINIINDKKLENIHDKLKINHGSLCDELPEQKLVVKYLTGNEKVLEIGGKIGRNSLVIASIINNNNFVSLESDTNIAKQLEENRNLNSYTFHIENSALSKRKLIQRGWDTKPSDVLETGYNWVNTITLDDLNIKYNIEFDTLILDCEGAFYYILMDMPEILKNIKLIIMENDYHDISHKNYVDSILNKYNFYNHYQETGGWGCCYDNFYEVWKKMPC